MYTKNNSNGRENSNKGNTGGVVLLSAFMITALFGGSALLGSPSPSVDADLTPDENELTLNSVENTDYVVVVGSNGTDKKVEEVYTGTTVNVEKFSGPIEVKAVQEDGTVTETKVYK